MSAGTATLRFFPRELYVETEAKIYADFKDENGAAINPTTVKLLTQSPCGTETTYTYGTNSEIARPSTGSYTANIQPTEAGVWSYRWVTTVPVIAAEGRLNVRTSAFFDSLNPDYIR